MTEVADRASTAPSTPSTAPSASSTTSSAVTGAIPLEPAPVVDVETLGELLLGRWADIRRRARAVVAREEFQRVPGLGMDEHRIRVRNQLAGLVELGETNRAFPARLGGGDDAGGNLAGFEELVLADPSLQIKSGVQYGLFGAAVLHLGTPEHHDRLLPGIMRFDVPGAFAMTETGHGSDVASIATTATFDEGAGDFVLHTPFRAAWKDYIGNAAIDGRAAVVFAQLVTRGVNHGVHAFYVPLRDADGAFLPGVGGEDDGLKGGLNGIDNGRLHFDHVRVPRENLLNRYGDVAADGTYSSPIASPGRRFFTMLGTLVQGRVSLDGAAALASRAALTIAIRYASERRQFTGGGAHEEVLLDYGRHQRRLLPRLATAYAMTFAHEQLLQKFDDVFSGAHDTDADRQDLETLAAALKPFSTWNALEILQEAREACGGAGFLAENRLAQLRADLDIYVTFEGDNNVLMQLVAKRLLTDHSKRFAGANAGAMAQWALGQVGDAAVSRSGLRRVAQTVVDFGSTARSVGHVRGTASQRQLLTDRVQTMVGDLALKLRTASKSDPVAAAALFNRHQNALIEAAKAHAELLEWEAFTDALDRVDDDGTRRVLTWLRDLFGFTLIEKHLDWYLIAGRLSASRAQAITDYIDDRLLPRLRPHALALTEAFGLTPELLRAEIATGAEAARQDEARAHAADLVASGSAPVKESAPARS